MRGLRSVASAPPQKVVGMWVYGVLASAVIGSLIGLRIEPAYCRDWGVWGARVTKNFANMLDRGGHLINGVSVDWIAILALIAYLVAMETRTGATLGKRAMQLRVIDSAAPVGSRVPPRKIVLRYLVMAIGILPILVLNLAVPLIYGSDLEELAKFIASSFFLWVFIGGYMVGTGWAILLIVQVAKKRDPLYDRMAGTAVLRASHDHRQDNHTG
jgi:uncharacterized RDD family membrane protein YckC